MKYYRWKIYLLLIATGFSFFLDKYYECIFFGFFTGTYMLLCLITFKYGDNKGVKPNIANIVWLLDIAAVFIALMIFLIKTYIYYYDYKISFLQMLAFIITVTPYEITIVSANPLYKDAKQIDGVTYTQRSLVKYGISSSISKIIIFFLASTMGWFLFSLKQILFIKLLADTFLLFALSFSTSKNDIANSSKLGSYCWSDILITGLVISAITLYSYMSGLQTGSVVAAGTIATFVYISLSLVNALRLQIEYILNFPSNAKASFCFLTCFAMAASLFFIALRSPTLQAYIGFSPLSNAQKNRILSYDLTFLIITAILSSRTVYLLKKKRCPLRNKLG